MFSDIKKIAPFLFLFLFLSFHFAWAEELSVPLFTDPSKVIDMGEAWDDQSIMHEGEAEKADLSIVLDQHLYPALIPLIKEFAKKNNLNIAVLNGTCGISAGKLREKKADMGGFCCPAGETDRLPGLAFHTLGIASLALLVNEANPLNNLDLERTKDIFSGRVTYWNAFGEDIPKAIGDEIIRPIGRLHCKARPGHWRLILDNEDMFTPRLHEVSTIPDMISNVERKPGAIGYEVLWMVEMYKGLHKIKTLKINGYSPYDNEALAAGNYPFYRTFNITTWVNEPAKSRWGHDLAIYLIDKAPRIDSKFGIIPVQMLHRAGWKFTGNELTGEPD